MTTSSAARQPIAIVGVSALFPGSQDATGFWRDILQGRDLLTDVPPTHWRIDDYYDPDPSAPDKTYARRGGFLSPIDFDALGWGIPPSTLPATDTAQLLALIVAQSVLQDAAGAQFATMDRSRISVILGVTSAQELLFSLVSRLQRPVWVKALRESGLPEDEVIAACDRIAAQYVPWQEASFPGLLGNVVAGRIANRLNLGGTNCVTDAACASTFSAVQMAVNELQLGHSDMAIAGGVDTLNDIFMYMCFSKTPALSPSGDCRPFSDQADGTMLGEGLGMVALKRLADAERDGDRIYAMLRGIGTASDGRSKSVYAPVAAGQAQALRRAYAIAGYGADTVELMEAHGTGTKAGDIAEFEGLRSVFSEADSTRTQWCALGSVKSQIGHTKAAAGAAGLFKTVMALHHKILPPGIKIDAPNPKLEIERSPFHLNTRSRPWIRGSDHPRRASVSAFGFGGSNFHLTLEEYLGSGKKAERLPTQPCDLVLIAAGSAADLLRDIDGMVASSLPLARIAHASRVDWDARNDRAHRLAIVAATVDELHQRLATMRARIVAQPQQAFDLPDGSSYGNSVLDGKVAMLFPGQGSQYADMGAAIAMQFGAARSVWDSAADIDMNARRRLHDVVFAKPAFDDATRAAQADVLTRTEWAQPAIGAHSAALLAVLRDLGIDADAFAGHSFGEVTALHAAGAFDAGAALRIARRRGELMRDASTTPGAMTALNMSRAEVEALITQHAANVVIANHNAPRQVVVSGATDAIEAFESSLQQQGQAFRRLSVATAFHSPLVAGCSDAFANWLEQANIENPVAEVFSNDGATRFGSDAAKIRAQLAAQIAHPVQFVAMIEAMHADGLRTFIEVGPGSVLSGLVSSILGDAAHRVVSLDRKGRDGVESLLQGLARLAACGVAMHASKLFADTRLPLDADAKPKLSVAISGSNFGKPYPPANDEAIPAPNPPRAITTPLIVAPLTPPASPTPRPNPAANATNAIPAPSVTRAMPQREVATMISTPNISAAWLAAFQESQQQTAAAHEAFQRTMADSHAAYLKLSESALLGLSAAAFNSAPVGASVATPPVVAAPAMAPHATPATRQVIDHAQPVGATSVEIPKVAAGSAIAAHAAPTIDLELLLLTIVAEKTGYPVDMLQLDMDLEGDLGIDSIKRVEIIAAVDERAPQLPKVDRARLSALHTLREIMDYLQPVTALVGAASGRESQSHVEPSRPEAAPTIQLEPLLLAIVAEKTGYPVDMLQLDMDLEGDLGIDSIKRVEILAAVDERAPQLPKADRARLSALHTLREIMDYLQPVTTLVGAASGRESQSHVEPSRPEAAPTIQLESLLLTIVAEKTGYPVDMLQLDMDLEGDLGIDSIKRVEILAAVDERAPQLPKADRARLSALHTLREIMDYLQPVGAHPGATEAAAPSSDAAPSGDRAQVRSYEPPALGRYVLESIPAPPTGFAMAGLLTGMRVHVLGEDALAALLAESLRARGVDAVAVTALPATATACVYLGGLREVDGIDAACAINREAFGIARLLAQQLQSSPGLFVTVQDSGGNFGLGVVQTHREWLGGMPALIKTCALEWPQASVKSIDVMRGARTPSMLAEAIADELIAGGGEIEIALSEAGQRRTLRSVERAVDAGSNLIADGDVVVVSGGARGVTAACVIEWAARCRARFVLIGRTPMQDEPASCKGIEDESGLKRVLLIAAQKANETVTPAIISARVHQVLAQREVRQTLAAITAQGATARYCAVAIDNRDALAATLDDVRRSWGPIHAVVHAAGVLADRRIADKTDAQFAQVFDTKVQGLRHLLDATAADPLKLLCVFSSVSARCGNSGQSDYAMANEVLAKVAAAEARKRPELRVKSLGWGPWEGGMVTPQLKERFALLGVPMIPLAIGARMFADEMNDASGAVELVLGGAPRAEALLFDGADSRVEALELRVRRDSHGWLEGHAVDGRPVVPVVLVAEWLARAAQSFRPGLEVSALHDLTVLKGIRLDAFENGGDAFRIEARPLQHENATALQMTVRDSIGRARYSAIVEMRAVLASTDTLPALALEDWQGASPYDSQLFHRERFTLIERMHGISDHGVAADVLGVIAADWPKQEWQFDVAALDAGMQLAVLYGQRMLGGANLPTSIASLRRYATAGSDGTITATAYRRAVSALATTTDIVFTDGNGQRFAELIGVQNHALAQA